MAEYTPCSPDSDEPLEVSLPEIADSEEVTLPAITADRAFCAGNIVYSNCLNGEQGNWDTEVPLDCPVIVEQPESLEIAVDGEGTFTVVATTSESVISYQWQILVDDEWVDIENDDQFSDATTATLVVDFSEDPYAEGTYDIRCVLTADGCEVETDEVILSVIVTDLEAWILIVGGGGGGGAGYAGGGGGGQVEELTGVVLVPSSSYPVIVGVGGVGGDTFGVWTNGTDGTGSAFNTPPNLGGGGGAGIAKNGNDGASSGGGGAGGGGGGFPPGTYTPGTAFAGFSGGTGYGDALVAAGGGGGGAGGAGANGVVSPNPVGGNGGAGYASAISGSPAHYGAGGGAGAGGGVPTAGSGGSGIGGNGGTTGVGTGASPNTGSGGGGGGNPGGFGSGFGGDGADGVVIVRYPGAAVFTGGTVTTSGGDTIHTFTSSGNLVPI